MTESEFSDFVDELFNERTTVMRAKGNAYSGTENRFANFEKNAERLGLSKYQVWLVYFMKHIDSIGNAIKDNPCAPVDKTEGLRGRIIDAQNYLDLLAGMLESSDPEVQIRYADSATKDYPAKEPTQEVKADREEKIKDYFKEMHGSPGTSWANAAEGTCRHFDINVAQLENILAGE